MEKGEQFLLFSTIFCNLILDFCIKTWTRFSLRDKGLFEITEVKITRVDCRCKHEFTWNKVQDSKKIDGIMGKKLHKNAVIKEGKLHTYYDV